MNIRDTPRLAAGLALGLTLCGSWTLAQTDREHHAPPPPGQRDDPPGPHGPDGPRDGGMDDPFDAPGPEDGRDRRFGAERWERHFDDVVGVLRDIDPQLAERVESVREDRPGTKLLVIRRTFPQVFDLVKLRGDDPAMYTLRVEDVKLHRRSDEIARSIRDARRADDARRVEELTDELEPVVQAHFELRQQVRELEIERLEERLDALKDALRDRDRDRRDLVEERLQQLVGREEGAGF